MPSSSPKPKTKPTSSRNAPKTRATPGRSLPENEKVFRALVQNSVDVILVQNPDETIRFVSPSLTQLLGYEPSEWIGQTGASFLHPEEFEVLKSEMERLSLPGSCSQSFCRVRHKNGAYVHCDVNVRNLVHDPDVQGVMVSIHDVSEQRHLLDQLLHAQKMEAVGRLGAGIAHDFNNVLSAILTFGEAVREDLLDGDPLVEDLEEILSAAHRGTALTRRLLAFSRKQVVAPSNLALNAVLRDTEKMVRRLIGEDIELTFTLDDSTPRIHVDRGQLEQVILNLVINARDAMPRGGQLHVSSYPTGAPSKLSAGPVGEPKWACLEVRDTGHGMPPEVLARIFEPFFTTKDIGKGTGLGLSTVYGIVTQSKGEIKACSKYLEGSTFQVLFPPSEEQAQLGEVGAVAEATLPRGLRVLLIEDDPKVMIAARRALEGLGCEVVEARGPEDAIRVAKGIGKTISVLVADVIMPKKSGPEVAREVSKVAPNIRVLFMTGYIDEVVERHLPPNDTYALLQKPFTKQSLRAKLIEALAIEHPSGIISVRKID